MSEHAILPPSSAGIWGHCSQFVWENQAAPDVRSPESMAGDAAHWLGQTVIGVLRTGQHMTTDCFLNTPAPNGVLIDEKIAEGAAVYVAEAVRLSELCGGWGSCLNEQRVSMPDVHAENWGTLDLAFYSAERKTIYLRDYKHGYRVVSAEGNLQLIDYVLGLANFAGIDGVSEQEIYVDMGVIQPYAYRPEGPVANHVCKLSDLRGARNQLHYKAHEAFNAPKMTPGAWCRDCPALKKRTCGAARIAVYNVLEEVSYNVEHDTMGAKELATFYEQLEDAKTLVSAMLDATEDHLKQRIAQGAEDTGYTVQTKIGRKDWTEDRETVITSLAMLGVDASAPGIKTPTQVLKSAPVEVKPAVEALLKQFAKRPVQGSKLTKAQEGHAARAFSKGK